MDVASMDMDMNMDRSLGAASKDAARSRTRVEGPVEEAGAAAN